MKDSIQAQSQEPFNVRVFFGAPRVRPLRAEEFGPAQRFVPAPPPDDDLPEPTYIERPKKG